MFRHAGLDDEVPLPAAASAPSPELFQGLERLLICPEILKPEQGVRGNDCGEFEPGEVEAFRDYLCAYQDVRFSRIEFSDCFRDLASGRIAVEPGYSGIRETGPGLFFDFLCAAAKSLQYGAAFPAMRFEGFRIPAVVACQAVRRFVETEAYVAVRAFRDFPAFRTLHYWRERTSGPDYQDLSSVFQGPVYLRYQFFRKRAVHSPLAPFCRSVQNLHVSLCGIVVF